MSFSFTALSYDLRRAETADELLSNFLDATPINQSDIISGNLSNPQEFGHSEIFSIRVPIVGTTVTYAFAMKAIDNEGLTSDISNIAVATLRQYIPPTGPPPTLPFTGTTKQPSTPSITTPITTSPISTATSTVNPTTAKQKPSISQPQIIGIAVGSSLLVITVAILIALLLCQSAKFKIWHLRKTAKGTLKKANETDEAKCTDYESTDLEIREVYENTITA